MTRITNHHRPRIHQTGQALIELAVFGGIAIAALGFLIRVGMMMNYNQEVRMAAYRRALAAAGADNGTDQDAMGATYHLIVNRQMPDPSDGFMSMQRMRTEASAFVMWGDRLASAFKLDGNETLGYKTQPMVIIRSDNIIATDTNPNTELQPLRQEDFNPVGNSTSDQGVVTDSTTVNTTTSGSLAQTPTGSSMSSGMSTTSTSTLNTKAGGSISSTDAGTSTVNW